MKLRENGDTKEASGKIREDTSEKKTKMKGLKLIKLEDGRGRRKWKAFTQIFKETISHNGCTLALMNKAQPGP